MQVAPLEIERSYLHFCLVAFDQSLALVNVNVV
jgi:hypothetical protein